MKISVKSAKIMSFPVKIMTFSMKIKSFHTKISSVRENENFPRKCELKGFLVGPKFTFSRKSMIFTSTVNFQVKSLNLHIK